MKFTKGQILYGVKGMEITILAAESGHYIYKHKRDGTVQSKPSEYIDSKYKPSKVVKIKKIVYISQMALELLSEDRAVLDDHMMMAPNKEHHIRMDVTIFKEIRS